MVFCDFLKCCIPVRKSDAYATGGQSSYDGQLGGLCDRLWSLDLVKFSALTDLSLRARSVVFSDAGTPVFSELTHSWDSLPSSFSAIAFRLCQSCPQSGLPPRLEIQCSPATLAHVHNVISNVDTIEAAAWIVLSSAAIALPMVWERLDISQIGVLRVDVTDAIVCETPAQAAQVLERTRHISRGQRRAENLDDREYKSSVYWGATSELHRAVAYLKGPELVKKQASARVDARKNPTSLVAAERLRVLSNPALHELAGCMVRLEGRWLKRGLIDHLTRLGLTTEQAPWDGRLNTLIDLERRYHAQSTDSEPKNLLDACWDHSWHPVITALDGAENVDINDLTTIEEQIFSSRTPRRARPLLQFFRLLTQMGWEELKASKDFSRSTFYRRVGELCDLGISQAQLQQLDGSSESRIDAGVVIPMRRVLHVGRLTDFPSWFQPVDLENWTPFDPSVRRAVGAVVGPMPLPVSLVGQVTPCKPLPDVTCPRFEARMGVMDPDSRFNPSRPALAEPAQMGLDFSGPDSGRSQPLDPESRFTLALGRVRAAQVGEADQLNVRRNLIDGSEFLPRVPVASRHPQLRLV